IPSDYTVETLPSQQSTNVAYATYFNESHCDGKQLVTDRVLQVNGIFFRLDIYAEIKDFFRNVRTGDEQQAVLRGGSTDAHKTN
ncbi:MAG TPA: hypothetical protein VFP11_10280, partial [Candidatus Angelobacter sp.]|nr:hypothetical protein [Candidatus Angelobacter sp.]